MLILCYGIRRKFNSYKGFIYLWTCQFTFLKKPLILKLFCTTLEIKMASNNFKDTWKSNSLTFETVSNFSFELTEVSLLTWKTPEPDNPFKTENRLFYHADQNLPIASPIRSACLLQSPCVLGFTFPALSRPPVSPTPHVQPHWLPLHPWDILYSLLFWLVCVCVVGRGAGEGEIILIFFASETLHKLFALSRGTFPSTFCWPHRTFQDLSQIPPSKKSPAGRGSGGGTWAD